jgi:5-formyltetrahydrofolate cyclo-ligase
MDSDLSRAKDLKQTIRAEARARLRALDGKDAASRLICSRFAALPEYAAARTVLLYVHFGDEVRSRQLVEEALDEGKQVVVPYCEDGVLKLFRLKSMNELAPGTWRIPEPKVELRGHAERGVQVQELELAMVPGVAFDRGGGRLGHGKGYFDRLLAGAPSTTRLAALAFECQLFPEIPMLPGDVFMDKVITEKAVYEAASRRGHDQRR